MKQVIMGVVLLLLSVLPAQAEGCYAAFDPSRAAMEAIMAMPPQATESHEDASRLAVLIENEAGPEHLETAKAVMGCFEREVRAFRFTPDIRIGTQIGLRKVRYCGKPDGTCDVGQVFQQALFAELSNEYEYPGCYRKAFLKEAIEAMAILEAAVTPESYLWRVHWADKLLYPVEYARCSIYGYDIRIDLEKARVAEGYYRAAGLGLASDELGVRVAKQIFARLEWRVTVQRERRDAHGYISYTDTGVCADWDDLSMRFDLAWLDYLPARFVGMRLNAVKLTAAQRGCHDLATAVAAYSSSR